MPRASHAAILLILLDAALAAPSRPPGFSDSGGVLRQLSFASFLGSGNSVQGVATDGNGNVYVTGTTAGDFAAKNAAQPSFGDARILRTTDLGATWTRVGSPPVDIGSLAADPVAPQVLFAAAANTIYRSADGGQTWAVAYMSQSVATGYYPGNGSVAMLIDAGNHLRVAALLPIAGLLRSADGGTTWTVTKLPCGSFCAQPTLLADPTGSGTLLLLAPSGIYISRDWALTFQQLSPPGMGPQSTAAFDPSHPGWIYVDSGIGVSGTLSLSTDFGMTWTQKASPPSNFSLITYLAVDPDQPGTLVASTSSGLYVSTDGAASWTRQPGSVGSIGPFVIVSRKCSAGGLVAGGGGYGGVAFSPDYGATWNTPQLTDITSVTAGPGCSVYVTRRLSSDAFVAKLAPGGTTVWATYLGGSDQDAPVALAVDGQGSVYVLGDTTSPDFPSTAPRIGPPGPSSVFVTKFSPDGALAWSVLIGGEAANTASALAADANGNVYVVGHTNSAKFPVTPDALVTQVDAGSYTGFLAKLAPDASLAYATYLGPSYTFASAILADPSQGVLIAGTGAAPGSPPPTMYNNNLFLLKLDPATLQVVSAMYLGAVAGATSTALAADNQGNLFLAGTSGLPVTPGAYSSQSSAGCSLSPYSVFPLAGSEVHLMKLAAADWSILYSALLTAPCGIAAGALSVDSAGAVVLGLEAGNGIPLHNPLLAGPTCGGASSAVAKISPDGSTLQFATYLDSCGVAGIALAPDGSIYAGVSPSRRDNTAGVVRVNAGASPAISLDGIANAFSGDDTAVVGGGLYSLTGTGFGAPFIDLGINATRDLPFQLGGVQVTFDGIPAAILQTSPNRVIVVPPANLPAFARGSPSHTAFGFAGPLSTFTRVQLTYNGIASNAVVMPLIQIGPGLLSMDYPNPSYSNYPDGIVYNQDGSENNANHPAPLSSTITVFATGMGATNPPVAPGSIARSDKIVPVGAVYSSWLVFSPISTPPPPQTVSTLPGFVSALFQVKVQVPDSLQYLGGTDVGNGVQSVPLGLKLTPPVSPDIPIATNVVGVYVK